MTGPLRFATFAVPLSGNKGSASMLLGLIDSFQKSSIDTEFAVFSYYPQQDTKIAQNMKNITVHPGHPKHIFFQLLPLIILSKILPFLVPKKWKNHIAAIKDCDAVLLIGGTTFADSMLFKVPWNTLAALPGYFLKKETVFLSQTIGPNRKWINRLFARWTLSRAKQVHGRGRVSEDWAHSLKIPNVSYQPDLSFSLIVPDFDDVVNRRDIAKQFQEKINRTERKPVGIAPNSIVFEKTKKIGVDYVDFLLRVTCEVHEQGFLPVLIPHSYREGTKQRHNNDQFLCLSLLQQLPADIECFYFDADLDSRELRAIIGKLHLLIASRFHSMVSALSMGVPPITYGWGAQKYSEVLQEFSVDELYIPFQEMKKEDFSDRLAIAHTQRKQLSEKIFQSRETVSKQSEHIAILLSELLHALHDHPN